MKRFFFTILLGTAVLILDPGGPASPRAVAQSKPEHTALTIEQVNRWQTGLSNWGRSGKDDERGALNLITPQKAVQAARLVQAACTLALAHGAQPATAD